MHNHNFYKRQPLSRREMIKAIIFDIGGVIQGLDWTVVSNNLVDLKEDLSYSDFKEALYKDREKYFNEYCKGKLSSQEFWKGVAHRLGLPEQSVHRLSTSFEELYCFIDEELLKLIKQLKSKFKLFTLANTTPELEKKAVRTNRYVFLFDKLYWSHKIGARKPEPEAFQKILDENNLKAEECIFVDNAIQNIRAARALGFNCILYSGHSSLTEEIYNLTMQK